MIERIKSFYHREDIQTERQKNIDYAKAIAIIGMVLIHTMLYPYYNGFEKGFGYFINDIWGGILAAPVFMTSMGVGLAYSQKNSPKQIILRGCKLVALNYILNVLRAIYSFFAIALHSEDFVDLIIFYVFNGDILLFAGLAMIMFGLLKYIRKNSDLYILLIAIVLSVISTAFRITENENALLAYTLGTFIPVNYYEEPVVYFQLCSWFIFVAVGNAIGITVRKCKNKDRFYLLLGAVGAVMTGMLLFLDKSLGWQQYFLTIAETKSEYLAGIGYAGIALGVVFVQFSFFHFICKATPEFLNRIVSEFSSAINEIYLVSWIIILNISYAILQPLLGDAPTIMWPYFLAFSVVFPLSVWLAFFWRKRKAKHRERILQTL